MLTKVISGGQTGVDQAALRAAKAAGLATGGWAPEGWLTEDGPAPWLADFGILECAAPGYPARTRRNVLAAHGCLWFGNPASPGGKLTQACCRRAVVPFYCLRTWDTDADVAAWLRDYLYPGRGAVALLVAGNRESKAPGIGARAEAFLAALFSRLCGRP